MDLKLIYERTRDRQDFAGIEFKVNYGSYPPLCFTDSSHGIDGIFVDYMKAFCLETNLQLVFQPSQPSNHDIWFSTQNGSISGLLAEINSTMVDGSVAGFSYTETRGKYADYSDFMFATTISLFTKTPQDSDLSLSYYIQQFLGETWVLLFFVIFLIILLLGCTMINIGTSRSTGNSLKDASTFALATTYAAFLSKVKKNVSVRCAVYD